jgi:hypothetical protein
VATTIINIPISPSVGVPVFSATSSAIRAHGRYDSPAWMVQRTALSFPATAECISLLLHARALGDYAVTLTVTDKDRATGTDQKNDSGSFGPA